MIQNYATSNVLVYPPNAYDQYNKLLPIGPPTTIRARFIRRSKQFKGTAVKPGKSQADAGAAEIIDRVSAGYIMVGDNSIFSIDGRVEIDGTRYVVIAIEEEKDFTQTISKVYLQ